MKLKFTPKFIKEKQKEISEKYWESDNGFSDDEWMISWCFDEIAERDKRIKELRDELMYYQMECPSLVGTYQSPEEKE